MTYEDTWSGRVTTCLYPHCKKEFTFPTLGGPTPSDNSGIKDFIEYVGIVLSIALIIYGLNPQFRQRVDSWLDGKTATKPAAPIKEPNSEWDAAARRLGFEPTKSKILDHFPEQVIGKKVTILNARFAELTDLFVKNLPGVTISSDGLTSRVNLTEKQKWLGFCVFDSDEVFCSQLFAQKAKLGSEFLNLGRNSRVHLFGQVVTLQGTGGKAGFIVEAVVPAGSSGPTASDIEKLERVSK